MPGHLTMDALHEMLGERLAGPAPTEEEVCAAVLRALRTPAPTLEEMEEYGKACIAYVVERDSGWTKDLKEMDPGTPAEWLAKHRGGK